MSEGASRAGQWAAIAAAIGTGVAALVQSMGAIPENRAAPAVAALRLEVAELRAEVAVQNVKIEYLERGRMGGPAQPPRARIADAARRARAGALADLPRVEGPAGD